MPSVFMYLHGGWESHNAANSLLMQRSTFASKLVKHLDFFKFVHYGGGDNSVSINAYINTTTVNAQTHRQTDLAVELTSPFGRGQLKI